MKFPFIFVVFTLILLCLKIYSVWGKAPATAKIVLASVKGDNQEIYTMNPDATQQVNITRHKALDTSPVWSPTSKQILFVFDRDGMGDLFFTETAYINVSLKKVLASPDRKLAKSS